VLVDFYQLGGAALEAITASIAEKLLAKDQRLLIVADDEGLLTRLDRLLWDQAPTGFLPHGLAGGADDQRQPVLLSTSPDAPNLARNMLIADGQWRESALGFDRAFFLFESEVVAHARLAWKLLAGREGIERRYWAQGEGGGWTQQG
jgi:DNA polymerase-3 subunit chi